MWLNVPDNLLFHCKSPFPKRKRGHSPSFDRSKLCGQETRVCVLAFNRLWNEVVPLEIPRIPLHVLLQVQRMHSPVVVLVEQNKTPQMGKETLLFRGVYALVALAICVSIQQLVCLLRFNINQSQSHLCFPNLQIISIHDQVRNETFNEWQLPN